MSKSARVTRELASVAGTRRLLTDGDWLAVSACSKAPRDWLSTPQLQTCIAHTKHAYRHAKCAAHMRHPLRDMRSICIMHAHDWHMALCTESAQQQTIHQEHFQMIVGRPASAACPMSQHSNTVWGIQGGSTRPERIPATLTALQELNSKILQDLQQQLQDHLAACHKQFRAQVMGIS